MSNTTRELRIRWQANFESIIPQPQLESLFEKLSCSYNENARFYHNFTHISACLKHFDAVADKLDSPFLVELALWFHDVVYNPRKTNNEQKSADFAIEALQFSALSQTDLENIHSHILSTMHPAIPHSSDQRFLVDIDLSILAVDANSYDQYKKLVRQEYAFVPNFLYKRGRKKLLKALLLQDRIYHTDYFYEQWEERARENLEREIEAL